jgi:ATP-dependent Clp protease ATP-binding subunit ClpA
LKPRHRDEVEREMFERFTDRARNVVVLAQEEARMLNHNYIGTEHILLGLIHETRGLGAKALEAAGIGLEPARQRVAEIIGPGQQAPSGNIPFTPRAKKILELSLREALQLSHNYIGTEHILLGLIREGDGVAVHVLTGLGADLNRLRQQVLQLQADNPTTEEMPRSGRAGASARADAARADAAQAEVVRAEAARAEAARLEAARLEAARAATARAESAAVARKLAEILSRLDSISDRLAAIERTVSPGTAADDD